MSVPLLEAIADAIMDYEGWKPTSESYMHRNPGNLEEPVPGSSPVQMRKRVFPSLIDGYQALLADLTAKVTGHNSHGLGPSSSLFDIFEIYAPSQDKNDPFKYAMFVCAWLRGVYGIEDLLAQDPIELIFHSVGQELPGGITAA